MKVKIFDKKFIPGLGLGPFDKEYINIEINLFKQLKALGFNISEEPERKINYVSEAQYSLNITPSFEEIIKVAMSEEGDKCNLNFIDVSRIKDMSGLFSRDYSLESFNGDISEWDVSNVKVMFEMFQRSNFNGDISKWNVSNVKNMSCMFRLSDFNQDISDWDVSSVEDMSWMFAYSKFNQDISRWDVSSVKDMCWMFTKSNFNSDISKWNVSNVEYMLSMFWGAKEFNADLSKWDVSNVKDKGDMFKIYNRK